MDDHNGDGRATQSDRDELTLLDELAVRAASLRTRLEWHKARVDQLRDRAAMECDVQMASLRQEMKVARAEVSRMATTGDGAWIDLKTRFDGLWRDLTEEFETAVTRF